MAIDVAIAAPRAVGVGTCGCTGRTPDEIESGVSRIKAKLGDLPGVDLIISAGMSEHDNRLVIKEALPTRPVSARQVTSGGDTSPTSAMTVSPGISSSSVRLRFR